MAKKNIPITYVPIHGNSYDYKKGLMSILKSRITTQRRYGNLFGGICFIPSLIGQILKNSGHKTDYNKWIDKTLDSVYFELESGKIVPLRFVVHLYLKETTIKSILPCSGTSLPGIGPIDNISTIFSNSWYAVYLDYMENDHTYTNVRVYLGDDLNLAYGGIKDVTMDHIVPIRDILTNYANKLPYLTAISCIMQSVKSPSYSNVKSYITSNISSQIVNELNLIVQKTRGIRICSGRVN